MARKILLADDSVTAQNMGRKILADAGYEVITVNNGSAALKKISEQKPDLIVLDVYMPGYSGLEVCQRLKDVAESSRIPILLTVGKLEPFKPEEAKRVRADGFIVKPFEASELLSALSKLEDKVVPRAESSKPGRFARATAALEEGRYDKTMAVEEDDSWKSRIAFPRKKKEKPAEENVEDPAVYNPVNKDLRTVIEHKAAEHAPSAEADVHRADGHGEEAHVNLAALAPEGLPKDVTPEEIAALAAAAAQIKGKVEEKPATPIAEMPVTAAPEIAAAKPESVQQGKEDVRAAEPAPAPAAALAVTLAEHKTEEKTEEKKEEKKAESQIVSTHADAMTAMMGLETQMMAVHFPMPGDGLEESGTANAAPEPVTMAVATAADSSATPTRWTAVAVALPPEDAAISLEHEMQKAYAAFAAADGGHSSTASTATQETPPTGGTVSAPAASMESSAAVDAEATQPIAVIPATPAPEVVPPLIAVSEVATEAISAAVKELEAVAAKYEAEQNTASTEPVAAKPFEHVTAEPALAPVSDAPLKIEEKEEEKPAEKIEEPPVKEPEPSIQEAAAAPTAEFATPQNAPEEITPEVRATQGPEKPAPVAETPEVVEKTEAKTEVAEEKTSSEQIPTEPVRASRASTAGGSDDMAKRESETAQAWASWRKIRETGGSKPAAEASAMDEEGSAPQDKAAMAVAVGAESSPEEVHASLDSDPEIASIVDSVLADMRPKIVEEIARKLGKKK